MAENKKMIYGILAVLCFGLLSVLALCKDTQEARTEYSMVALGDSIMGQVRDETAIPYLVSEALGLKVFNGTLGGTCAGRLGESIYQTDRRDVLSLVSLSKSIAAQDFRVQKRVHFNENGTEHFPDTIEQLSQIDFSKVELLLLCYGANDYHAGEVIASEDPYDENTYEGALRSALRTLQNTHPDLRIVLVTPPYTWYPDVGLTCEEYVLGGNVLEQYAMAQVRVADELGIESIDLYHGLFPHETWEDWKKYSSDGLHPNAIGRELIAQAIIEHFESHPLQ